ncbi:MAG: MDR family oxidoreductase [Ilumatobacteraceae bacterium]
MFRALLIDQTADGISHDLVDLEDEALPDGDVTVAVEWSSLNFKDGLILTGQGRLVRDYPHVPGIDLAGVVEQSDDPRYSPGDRVALTGWRVGEVWWGGYATRARVKGDWLSPLPDALSTRQAMAIGTAGFTAMLAIDTLERHGLGTDAPIVVTGASGGVGSTAVGLLATLGYEVTASTGRVEAETAALQALGATNVIDRAEIAAAPERPLLSERWGGAVDAVGSGTLAHVLAETRYGGAVAACGLAGGNDLPTTVIPFLLRGVTLFGIDSVMCPAERRVDVWRRLGETIDADALESMTSEVTLGDLPALAGEILAGRTRGRVVVKTG